MLDKLNELTKIAKKNVLIVDDDNEMITLLKNLLINNAYLVDTAKSLSEALSILLKKIPDIIILDVMLPDGNGIDICRQIRSQHNIPIIMLTAIDSDTKKILSYEFGACQYITKPFNAEVLLAQIKSALRTYSVDYKDASNKRYIHFENLVLDFFDRVLIDQNGISIELSNSEYDLLKILIENNRNIISRDDVTRAIYNREYDGCDRAVDVVIGRLRKKVEKDTANPKIIKTIHGVGYIMVADVHYSDTILRQNTYDENKS
ncbi:response regulator transcription factor [Fastidiosibacter lacustris]|uniref:response regulator transcription factor n=1 Tax=Fastidiosibacter lacustris TaxID=2056695 RepID=UPI000E34D0B4|nr:response regulator transcription factor [Fastidiosibacter lacustris]